MQGFNAYFKVVFVIAVIVMIGYIAVDYYDTKSHNCQATGEQRMANSVDGIVVENKMVCDGGRVKWTRY